MATAAGVKTRSAILAAMGVLALAWMGPSVSLRAQADRASRNRERLHAKGGFFHEGRFATPRDVVDHYDMFLKLGLTAAEKTDLVEYLKSL